jgi:L-serine deaminase
MRPVDRKPGCIKLRFGPRAVSARSGHEGKKAPEGPTPKPIVTRCEPGRLAVRELDAALVEIVTAVVVGIADFVTAVLAV